jgi:hypothetical protein
LFQTADQWMAAYNAGDAAAVAKMYALHDQSADIVEQTGGQASACEFSASGETAP